MSIDTPRRRACARLTAALCLAASPIARTATAAAAPAEPIRLGLIEGLSGPFANAGEAVFRNLLWAVERVNARGGVRLPGGARPLALLRFDSKGNAEEALAQLRAAIDQDVAFILQGNSSAVAAALVDALEKHNARDPQRRALLLNYSAVDPALTDAQCSFWHFRFDAHADMRMAALVDVLAADRSLARVYLIGQDYSFGRHVLASARRMLAARRPDIAIVGEQLHPLGRVHEFAPYAAKIQGSGAQAVITGNWGNDLTMLVRAAREIGLDTQFFTFYGNALGAPAALGDAGIGRVYAVAEWHPNAGPAAAAIVQAFRRRFPDPRDDYLHARMQLMVEMLATAVAQAGRVDAVAVGRALEGARFDGDRVDGLHGVGPATMRADDHQLQQPLLVSVMDRVGSPGVTVDVEGSGFGFRTVRAYRADEVAQPHACRMQRPAPT
jgi:branched-chain amino acid transport system substrate-binding protein